MRMTIALPLAVLLLASGCTGGPDVELAGRMADLEGRVALLEGETAATAAAGSADAADTAADATPDLVPSEKEAFAAAAAEESLKSRVGLDEDAEIRFDDATDTLLVRAPAATSADLDAAWEAAQGLAELWGGLDAFQPVLDLQVGDVRCACSATLMKAVHAGGVDRQGWEDACR